MLRTIISSIISVVVLYLVLNFVYDNFAEARPIMDDAKNAVLYVYNYSVNRFGSVMTGGAIVLGILALAKIR